MVRVGTILVLLTLSPGVELYAQNQKIGYVDSDRILEQMPEYAGIEQRLSLLSDSWHEELHNLERQIERLEAEYEAREILYTEEMRQSRLAEIDELEEEYDRLLDRWFGPDGEYFLRQRELLEPIQRQVFEAVNRVAVRNDFDFVFDRAQDVRFLYAGPEWNLTQQVLEELGVREEETRQ